MSAKWSRRERRRLEAASQQRPLAQSTAQFFGKISSGPLPPPEDLEHYERIQPGLAERIVAMAEKTMALTEGQTKHRQDLERTVIRNNIRLAYLGLLSGFIMGGGGLVAAVILIREGRELGGGAAFIASLAALTGLFFYGRKKQDDELAKKRPGF